MITYTLHHDMFGSQMPVYLALRHM